MSTRNPATRREYISDAILWLKDALDEDRDFGSRCPSAQACLDRASERIEEARTAA